MIIRSAVYGIKLWGLQLVPILFPFMVLTKLFLWCYDRYFKDMKLGIFYQCLEHMWNLSSEGVWILFLSHLCGYPIGAQMIQERYLNGSIEKDEADYLLSICNQSSPAFIYSYLICSVMNMPEHAVEICFILYVATFLLSCFMRKVYRNDSRKRSSKITNVQNDKIDSFLCFFDNCIISSANICIKIGGYIIIFSILFAVFDHLFSVFTPLHTFISSFVEITCGLAMLKKFDMNHLLINHLCILTCFCSGGLCTMAQIKGMLSGTSLSVKPYIIGKCIYTCIVLLLYTSYFYLYR